MDSLEREDVVEVALHRQFEELWEWRRPTLENSVGPNDPSVIDTFEKHLNIFLNSARKDLLALSDAELVEIREFDPLEIRETPWLRHIKSGPGRLAKRIPPAIAHGFGHPSFLADFRYWCKMPSLGLHEALMLSVGAEPESITEAEIAKLQKEVGTKKLWAAQSFLLKRRSLFTRFFHNTGSGYSPESLPRLKAWFEHIELDIHPYFKAELENRLGRTIGNQEAPSKESLTSQERATLLKLIAAMACEQYSFNPNGDRNDATSRIHEDLASVGLTMDPKTIRKWLKEATNFVDKDYWTQD